MGFKESALGLVQDIGRRLGFGQPETPTHKLSSVKVTDPGQEEIRNYVGKPEEGWDRNQVLEELKGKFGERAEDMLAEIEKRREEWYRKR